MIPGLRIIIMSFPIELIESRHSVRSFKDIPLTTELKDKLRSETTYINTHEAGLNFQPVFDDSGPFEGFRRSYGMFKNVSNYLACIIDPTFPHAFERAGFYAEQFVMVLQNLGLGSCFVGGTFARADVNARMEVYEKLPFVVVFGHPDERHTSLIGRVAARIVHSKRRAPSDFIFQPMADKSKNMENPQFELVLRAVACAPSALNKQPVRIYEKEQDGRSDIYAIVEDYEKNAIELGIAKYNISAVIPGFWEWGNDAPFEKNP